ncbi:MAG TPA: hypothetical protein VGE14_14705 [Marmoricola sp.]
MSTTITRSDSTASVGPMHPALTAPLGAFTCAAALAAGELFDLNADPGGDTNTSSSEWLVTGGIIVVGLLIGYVLGRRAWAGNLQRLSRTAVGLAIASAVLFVAFWSGWPSVFSAVAIGLALEHRRRVGSFSPATAIAVGLGVLAFGATAVVCVIG